MKFLNYWFWCKWFGHRGTRVEILAKEGVEDIWMATCVACDRVLNPEAVLDRLVDDLDREDSHS